MSSPPIESLHEQKVNAAFRAQRLAAVPSDLLTLRNVVHVDLSQNELTRFPGALVAVELPRIEVLLLQDNLLFVLEDILALSQAPRLRELNTSRNPLRLQNNRVYLLEALLSAKGCDEELLLMDFHDVALKQAGEGMSRASMKYRSKLPRKRGFPMLMKMNNEWITDREVQEVEGESGVRIEYFRPAKRCDGDEYDQSQPTGSNKMNQRSRMMKMMTMEIGSSCTNVNLEDRHFDGSRKTMRQIIANNARGSTIPAPQIPQKFQIDVSTGNVIDAENEDDIDSPGSNEEQIDEAEAIALVNQANDVDNAQTGKEPDELAMLRQLFRARSLCSSTTETVTSEVPISTSSVQPREKTDEDKLEPWNYPASTFDSLGSEDRHYVRSKSKQTGEMLERDDHFFVSTPFVDCVVQCERSRRLTMRAVDLLASPGPSREGGTTLGHHEIPSCVRAAKLTETLNATFSREREQKSFEKVKEFETKRVGVNGTAEVLAAVSDYFLAEHMERHQTTSRLFNAVNDTSASSTTTTTTSRKSGSRFSGPTSNASDAEMSLSKVKLQNAVDLASSLLDPKQQRRMIQTLIDADAKVIDEERVALDQMAHRRRLAQIRSGKPPNNHDSYAEINHRSMSPWQVRNWKAKKAKSKLKRQGPSSSENSNSMTATRSRPLSASASTPAFRGITTVDLAAQDSLADVSSHELLLRCANIHQNAGRHMRGLAAYRHHFRDEEAEWEHMRHEPTNVVRRHLHRRLYRDTTQVQIGGTQYVFSPLFE